MAGMDKLAGRLTVLSEPMRLEILMIISAAGTCCASDILGHYVKDVFEIVKIGTDVGTVSR